MLAGRRRSGSTLQGEVAKPIVSVLARCAQLGPLLCSKMAHWLTRQQRSAGSDDDDDGQEQDQRPARRLLPDETAAAPSDSGGSETWTGPEPYDARRKASSSQEAVRVSSNTRQNANAVLYDTPRPPRRLTTDNDNDDITARGLAERQRGAEREADRETAKLAHLRAHAARAAVSSKSKHNATENDNNSSTRETIIAGRASSRAVYGTPALHLGFWGHNPYLSDADFCQQLTHTLPVKRPRVVTLKIHNFDTTALQLCRRTVVFHSYRDPYYALRSMVRKNFFSGELTADRLCGQLKLYARQMKLWAPHAVLNARFDVVRVRRVVGGRASSFRTHTSIEGQRDTAERQRATERDRATDRYR